MSKNVEMCKESMADYLDRIGAGKVLISREPLSYDWTPSELVGRKDELGELASMFFGIENHNVSCRAVITGNVGSGKTVLTRRFCIDVAAKLEGRRKVSIAHVNCRSHPSASQVLQQIASTLDSGHPERGFSSGEVIQSIRRNIRSRESHLLLILDEVDVLVRRDNSDLIYKLLRIDEDKEGEGTLSLIMVSQEDSLFTLFEAAIKSRLGESNILRMRPYVASELVKIARQRYEAACRPNSVSDEVLHKIGIFAEESGGDARMAIELLDRAIGEAEKDGREKVTEGDVLPSKSHSSSVEPNQVDGLKLHQKLVLLGICRRLKREEEISSGDASKLYELVCEENNETPKGYTTFWKYLKHLESEGLIVSRASSSNRGRGRTRYITMPNSVPAIIGSRIENELLRR
ncbi:MAG: Cdc6/Cdc18 family protein [Candidatus Thalassarchaeaceae archaeon]